jgi:hypothetical protein
MNFRYRSHQIYDIVKGKKSVREGQSVEFKTYKEHSKTLSLDLDLVGGPLLNMRFKVNAGRADDPETYRAALLLDDTRIRGVDYRDLPQKKHYKVTIPAGWHQNILDPNLSGDDGNRHDPLPDLNPTDLKDFLHKVAALWQIELPHEAMLI